MYINLLNALNGKTPYAQTHKINSYLGKPSTLTKFCESGWRWLYYSSAFVYGFVCLWDEAWFNNIRHCWYNYPHHDVSKVSLSSAIFFIQTNKSTLLISLKLHLLSKQEYKYGINFTSNFDIGYLRIMLYFLCWLELQRFIG